MRPPWHGNLKTTLSNILAILLKEKKKTFKEGYIILFDIERH